ncbi:MAG: DUF115 domain-containing protein [Candidatus Heimdallarchaeota archaeon]|nr:DUF115 domain-containing protein [Candidatus Heimdallarchaeota archaeon]
MKQYHQLTTKEYQWICNQLHITPLSDKKATTLLDQKLIKHKVQQAQKRLFSLLHGKTAFIFGAGPSLEEAIFKLQEMKEQEPFQNNANIIIIAVDGAAQAFLNEGIVPQIIVTDLDGSLNAIIKSHERGTLLLVHAHGDNIPKIAEVTPLLAQEGIIGTTQIEETDNVRNFGGFTDGDRAAYVAANMGARRIVLFAFDFGEKIGQYSKPEEYQRDVPMTERKRIKLEIAKRLLAELPEKFPETDLYNCTPKGEEIPNIPTIDYKELRELSS